ncbi:MAG: conjugal transfer protein TraG N-terminal domain-containing protein [Burkholderiales bacterium]|nr:conjugal transfer protein TraG N-terminal domain-containing protein [Burkholderiales bacterium]
MAQMVIYTYGASEYLNSVLESMSLLFDFNKHSELVWLYRIAAVLGVLILALRPFAAKGPDGSPGAIDWPWFFRFAIIMFVIVVPKSDVRIEDITLKKTYVVSNAPWALSTFGWLTSTIGYGLTNMYESVMGGGMNPIESYSGNGIAFGSQYYNALPSIAQIDANGMQVAQPFIAECLLPAITPINTRFSGFTRNQLFNSPNYMDAMRGMSTNYLKNRYVYTDVSNGTVMTCLELRDSLLSEFNQQGEIVLNMAGLKNWNTITELDNTYIKQATDASANSLKQAMMINAIYASVQAQAIKLGDSGTADSLYQARAQYQQISAWRQGSQFASVSLVWLHIVVESMAYALWPLITFLILFPWGWQVLMEYIKVLFWIQLWPVMYAILNSIIAVYAVNKSNALAMQYGGFTLSSFFRIGDLNGGIVSTAGYLSTMVPVLTWMLMQRAGMGVMGAVSGFSAATNSSATEAGKQEALGDMQINRVNMGDRNFTTTTTTGENVNKNISSTGTVTSVGDVSTIQSSAMDNKLISGVNYQQAAQHQLSNQRSELETQAGSMKTAFANARQSLYNAQKGTQGSESHTTGNGLKQSDAIGNALQVMTELQAGLGVGGGKAIIGASGGINVKSLNDMKESLSKLKDSADSYSHGGNASITNAFAATQGVIQQSEKMISMAESYQKMESTINSSGYSIQTNGDMELVKDLKSQGYTEQQMLDMQQNDSAKFNQLASDFAGRYVRSLGDTQNYSTDGLNHDAAQGKINKLANQYGNNGGNDSVTGGAQQYINDKNAYVTHENKQQQDLYEYQNQKQNDPLNIIGDQASQVGGVVGKAVFGGLTRRGEKEAERIANGGAPVGKKYLTGKD